MKEDYYALLGVTRESDEATIKRAYLARAKQLHPDLNDGVSAAEEMKALNLAYELLSDPARRAEYDAETAPRRPSAAKVDFDFDLAAQDFAASQKSRRAILNQEFQRMQSEGWDVERVHDHLVCTRTDKRSSIVDEFLAVIGLVLAGVAVLALIGPGIGAVANAAKDIAIPLLLVLGGGLFYAIRAERRRPPRRQRRVTVSVGLDGVPMVHVQPA